MENKPMKILIIEDDKDDCNSFINAVKQRDDIEIVAITDSDAEGLMYVKSKHPEGIVLDLELNNSLSGSTDSFEFLNSLKTLNYEPIVIVTTHINSKNTYNILHKNGVDLILYKDHPTYSSNHVLNNFINLRKFMDKPKVITIQDELDNDEERISKIINAELDLIGVSAKMKGREYIHDAILYLLQNKNDGQSVIQYLAKQYKRSSTTITNGIQNAIVYAWRIMPVEDIEKYYTARVNYETGVPTPMEFLYYYFGKFKKMI